MPNPSTTHLTQTSVDIYGAARLGAASLVREVSAGVSNITFVGVPVYDSSVIDQRIASANYAVSQLPEEPAVHERWLGYKQYELSNHPARAGQVLGNVTATLSDAKSTHYDGAVHYTPRITSPTDYYPFGAGMPGRGFSAGEYRYGFQGQEKDDEIKGAGNSINYKYRMHDPRIGRFFAVDPLAASFPWNSSYAFSENRVVDAVELEGLEQVTIHQESWIDSDGNSQTSTTDRGANYEGLGNEGFFASQTITNDDGTTFSGGYYFPPVEIVSDSEGENYTPVVDFAFVSNATSKTDFHFGNDRLIIGGEIIWDEDWFVGSNDAGLSGGILSGEKGWNNGGKQLCGGVVSLVTAPITILAGGAYYTAFGTLGLLNAVDDLGYGRGDNNSFSMSLASDDKLNYVHQVKGVINVTNALSSIAGSTKVFQMGSQASQFERNLTYSIGAWDIYNGCNSYNSIYDPPK